MFELKFIEGITCHCHCHCSIYDIFYIIFIVITCGYLWVYPLNAEAWPGLVTELPCDDLESRVTLPTDLPTGKPVKIHRSPRVTLILTCYGPKGTSGPGMAYHESQQAVNCKWGWMKSSCAANNNCHYNEIDQINFAHNTAICTKWPASSQKGTSLAFMC